IGGDAERYCWFVRCPTAPDVDDEPRVRDPEVPRRAPAVASAQNYPSEDRLVKSKRSFDVGDGDKVRDGKPILRRHLIAFLLDLYLVHRRLHLDHPTCLFIMPKMRASRLYGPAPAETTIINMKA